MISHHVELQASEIFDGAVELDESYFGGIRKGKRGRGAAGKVLVLDILKRGGKVFTKVVIDTKTVP
jgi:transposase